jgi:hypothetical protein
LAATGRDQTVTMQIVTTSETNRIRNNILITSH